MSKVQYHYCTVQEFEDGTFYVRQGMEELDTESEKDKEWVYSMSLNAPFHLMESYEGLVERPRVLKTLRCDLMKEALSESMRQKERYLETLSEEDLQNYEKARKITYAILEQTI